MKKVFTFVYSLLFLVFELQAQQLPNANFEDWSGATFDGQVQPKSWNASNVTQFGFSFNFAHREAGHTGNYSLMVQDQDVGVAGITETSPGYASLGTPWVYVKSLTSLSEATAGDNDGINFTYRPDTMAVWIKRTGSHTADEDFHLLYYSWVGQSKGDKYKGKNGNCTSVTKYDEESDIRLATNGNECGTTTKATQIAEGWYRARATYNNWTLVKVPIYYNNDQQPTRLNVIFSASNYPNFRANNGLYAGNSLYVDDIQLIYSSKIQHLYIDGKEWLGFDPNNTEEQIYSLGQNATVMPTITARRGEGALTNTKGITAAFAGRQLGADEMTITQGEIDGAPTTITVSAEDGSSTTTYKIKFVRAASTNACLSKIQVNGTDVTNFNPYLYNYTVQLPYGTTATPVVTAQGQEDKQVITITQATSLQGTATIHVLAADKQTQKTYTLQFAVAQLSDNTLQDIKVNQESVPGFIPSQTNYRVSLPLGTTTMPSVQAISAYPPGEQTIQYTAPQQIDGGVYQIAVTTPGNPTPKNYKLTFKIEASSYSKLADLQVGGESVPNFSPTQYTYYVTLPLGTTSLPAITYTKGDAYQIVEVVESGIDGTTRVTVTAANGDQTIYKIVFNTLKSEYSYLSGILIGGDSLVGFEPDRMTYNISLPIGTEQIPAIVPLPGDEYQTISVLSGGINGITRISVTAGDGTVSTYILQFSVQQADNATLNMIYLDGQPLEGFLPSQAEYTIHLPKGTQTLPVVTYERADEWQTINVKSLSGVSGDYKLTVIAQTGAKTTYILHFSVEVSNETRLDAILINGVEMAAFHADSLNYIDTLEAGVSHIPDLSYRKMEASQRVVISEQSNTYTILVTAESGDTRIYTVTFVLQKSQNAFLQMIYLDGVPLQGFSPQTLLYTDTLVTASCPHITVDKEPGQQVVITQPLTAGTAEIRVTPEQGSYNTYLITFVDTTYQSGHSEEEDTTVIIVPKAENRLRAISVNGEPLPEFQSDVLTYTLALSSDEERPLITYTPWDSTETIVAGWTSYDEYTLHVKAENNAIRTYTVTLQRMLKSECRLLGILLDGVAIDNFSRDTYTYSREISDGQALPQLSVQREPEQTVVMSSTSHTEQQILVIAENGQTATYKIEYNVLPGVNALLTDILLDGVALPAFQPETMVYEYVLPVRTKVVPCITPLGITDGQVVTIAYGQVGDTTRVHVVAKDGIHTADYRIHFTREKLTDVSLNNIEVFGYNLNFNPEQTEYAVVLDYGTEDYPFVEYTKSMPEQRVEKRTASDGETWIDVRAESGAQRTYHIQFSLAQSLSENKLNKILVNDIEQTLTDTIVVPLAYGATEWTVTYEKNYAEQTVLVSSGSVYTPTTLRVLSNRPDVADKVYVVVPQLQRYNPAVLAAITVNGEPIPNFRPDQFSYVVNVEAQPTIAAEAAADVTVTTVQALDTKTKTIKFKAAKDGYENIYTVAYYYTNCLPPFDMSGEWVLASKGTGYKPSGWKVPADYSSGYDWSTLFDLSFTYSTGKEVTPNGNGVMLSTLRGASMKGSCVGQMTLGAMAYNLSSNGSSTSSVTKNATAGITFRNTPEQISVRVKPMSANNISNWKFWLTLSDGSTYSETNYTGNFNNKNTWQTVIKDLNYGSITKVEKLNVLLSSCDKENCNNYGSSTIQESSVIYQDLHFVYNSVLAGATIDGHAASISGTDISYSLTDAEYAKFPELHLTHEVDDQMAVVTWEEEQGGKRRAQIRNFGEDGSWTDYLLTVTRPLSAVNTLAHIRVGARTLTGTQLNHTIAMDSHLQYLPDVVAERGSEHQTLSFARAADTVWITVVAETGEESVYTLHFVAPDTVISAVSEADFGAITPSSSQMASFTIDGQEREANASRYEIARPELILFTRQCEQDSVAEVFTTDSVQYTVIGDMTNTYTFVYPIQASDMALLDNILVNGTPMADFVPSQLQYSLMTDSAIEILPIITQGQTLSMTREDSLINIDVTAADGHTKSHYQLVLSNIYSSNATLSGIWIDGVALNNFHADILHYDIIASCANPKVAEPIMPNLSYATTDPRARVQAEVGALGETTYLEVTSSDGNHIKIYELNFRSEPSHNAILNGIKVDGVAIESFRNDRFYYSALSETNSPTISCQSDDRFQTVKVTYEQNMAVVVVTAEDGTTQNRYFIELFQHTLSSDATLQMIYLDGDSLTGFDPMQNTYSITLPVTTTILPDVSALLKESSQQVEITHNSVMSDPQQRMNLCTQIKVTAEDGRENTYAIHYVVPLSSNTRLKTILLDGDSLVGFQAEERIYQIQLPIGQTTLPQVFAQKEEVSQQVVVETVDLRHVIHVHAEDGTTADYIILYSLQYADADTLLMLYYDNHEVENFDPHTFYYSIELPVATRSMPEITWDVADSWQTVDVDTVVTDTWQWVAQYTVTAGNGHKNSYTVSLKILQSTVDTLQQIYVNNRPLENYNAHTLSYDIVLPSGTTDIPEVFAVPGDEYQQVKIDEESMKVVITTVSEAGNSRTYTLSFSVAPSTDAGLSMIWYAGQPLPGFDEQMNTYRILLPYGTTQLGNITFAKKEEAQKADLSLYGDSIAYIHVVAEDGITCVTYTIRFVYAKSPNATLSSILVDEQMLDGFSPEVKEYDISVPKGAEWPVVEFVLGDEEQSIVIDTFSVEYEGRTLLTLTVTVTAPDEETMEEYVIHLSHARSNDATLSWLQVRGEDITTARGFSQDFVSDSLIYTIQYAVGTNSSDYFGPSDITYATRDADATVSISASVEGQDSVIRVLVMAENELDNRTYTLIQRTLLSSNNRLRMIYLDGHPLRDFTPEQLDYSYQLLEGQSVPEISFEAEDERAVLYPVTPGVIDEVPWMIICEAEDGSTSYYTIRFEYSDVNSAQTPASGDVLVQRIPGTMDVVVVSLRSNVSVGFYTYEGIMENYETLEAEDPNNTVVETDGNGQPLLTRVYDTSNCTHITLRPNVLYFYTFFENGKRVIKSGKIMIVH